MNRIFVVQSSSVFLTLLVTLRGASSISWVQTPEDTLVREGQATTLNCKISTDGSQHPVIAWVVNPKQSGRIIAQAGVSIDDCCDVTGDMSDGETNLIIKNTTQSHDGVWQCQVAGLGMKNARLTVIGRDEPRCSKLSDFGPRNEVIVGTTVALKCSTKSNLPSSTRLVWMKDNIEVDHALGSPLPYTERIENFNEDHGVTFSCKVRHRGIDTPWVCPNTITLDVQFPPVINVPPYRCVKNGTQLGCEYTPGNPPTTQVKWKTPNDETAVRDNPLTIGDFEVQHSGNYTCIVNNTFFDGSQGRDVGITMVEVQYNPIVSTPVVYDIKEGEGLKLDCSVKSVPAANEIKWITPSGSIYQGNTLTLPSVRRGNAGLYTCHATNTFCDDIGGHGTGTSSTVVSVKYSPLPIDSGFEGDKITKNEHTDTLTSKPSKSTLYQHVTTTRFRMISERTHNQRDGVKLKYMKISVAIIGVCLVAVIAVTTVVVRSIRKRSKSHRETGRAGDYEEILETELPRTAGSAEIIPLSVVPISDDQTQVEQSDDDSDSSDSGYMNLIDERKSQTYMKPWTSILEFQRDRLHIVKTISAGRFQTVLKGFAWCIDGKDGPSEVIVKRENDDLDAKFKGKVSNEIQLLRRIPGHIYITKPIGCCTGMGPTYLLFEHAPCGSLKAFLKANRQDLANASLEVQSRLLKFAVCIASGMKHLAELEIVHRYLASKHILVYEGGVCKISNFSYASDVIDADMFFEMNQDKLPYKWMAVESLVNKEFTSMTDVWSFGVVLWEIFSLGSVPYRKLSRTSMLSLLDKGHRLVKPDLCRKEIFEIMLSCWKWSAVSRPTFAVIREQLQALLDYKDRPPVGVNIESTSVSTAEQK